MLYRRPDRKKNSILVDLSPLIDVVFLLLIFFMVSTRFKDDHGLDLALPSSESRQSSEKKHLTLYIDKNNDIRLNEEFVSVSELKDKIAASLENAESKMVVLKVDQSIEHGKVVEVMDAAKSAGAEGLTFATMGKPASADENK